MMLLVGAAFAVTAVVLVFTMVGAFYLLRGGRTTFSDSLPTNLPPEIVTCDNFAVSHSAVSTTDTGATRYDIQGECPVNPLAMLDSYIADLEYHGWTVHSDDSGGIVAYAYGRKEQLTATLSESSVNDNQTTLQLEVVTGVDQPPPDFPTPKPTPPSPTPRR